jgi:hypothetical protein
MGGSVLGGEGGDFQEGIFLGRGQTRTVSKKTKKSLIECTLNQ